MTDLTTKRERLATLRPLSPESVASLTAAFDVRMVYESSALEGNRLTYREVALILGKGIAVLGTVEDHRTIKTLHDAWLELKQKASHEAELTEPLLRVAFKRLTGWEHVDSFESFMSKGAASIAASQGGSATDPLFMADLFMGLPDDSVEKAARIHHRITKESRFGKSSSLIARLAMNFVLIAAGYPPISIPAELRQEYQAALEAADSGNFRVWLKFLNRQLNQELDQWLDALEISAPDPL